MSVEDEGYVQAELRRVYDRELEIVFRNIEYLTALGYNGEVASLPPLPLANGNVDELVRRTTHLPLVNWTEKIGQIGLTNTHLVSVVGMPGAGKTSTIEHFRDTIGGLYVFPEFKIDADKLVEHMGLVAELLDDGDLLNFSLQGLMREIDARGIDLSTLEAYSPSGNYFLTLEALKVLGLNEVMTMTFQMERGMLQRAPIVLDRGEMVDGIIMKLAYLMTHMHDGSGNLAGIGRDQLQSFITLDEMLNRILPLYSESNMFQSIALFLTSPELSLTRRQPAHSTSGVFRKNLYDQ